MFFLFTVTCSADQHLFYFDKFFQEMESFSRLSFNDPTIAYFLVNKHVNRAIKYTKHIHNNIKSSRSPESYMSGLIATSMSEKRKILNKFIENLPLKQYAGWFYSESWDLVKRWVDQEVLSLRFGSVLHRIYVSFVCFPNIPKTIFV